MVLTRLPAVRRAGQPLAGRFQAVGRIAPAVGLAVGGHLPGWRCCTCWCCRRSVRPADGRWRTRCKIGLSRCC
ncbi:MAG: hypothetical protein MZV65_48770 [Chromatiales bacterium]|nr:hypothetical protein [Chromatiales bacterium]